ncbi:COP9 signalosome complex subunit 9 [Planococcus citri]|uniref:COP9 signalosome complex subunit 9 n=1 Tax=Planococcus citri TaxID=170843 RepID=UPI0031F7A153
MKAKGSENYDLDEVADEMFSDGIGSINELDDSGNTNVILMDSSAIDKTVHADFFNDFEDLFDDDDDD